MALDPAFPSLSLIALPVLALIGLAGLGFSAFWHRRARKATEAAHHLAEAQRRDAVRLVRLVAHDLHEQGLSLLGQAGQLRQAGIGTSEQLSTSAGLLLGLADELGAYGLPDCLRLTIGLEEANVGVVAALAGVMTIMTIVTITQLQHNCNTNRLARRWRATTPKNAVKK